MKYLEARAQSKGPKPENKMLSGSREGQRSASPAKSPVATPSPEVRALADELGIDVSTVTGTGKDGAITKTDVRKAAAARDAQDSTAQNDQNS